WAPLGMGAQLRHLSGMDTKFLLLLLLVAVPFMWIGLAMTVQRLRDAGRPLWLTCAFFAPTLNLLLFLVLCALPSKQMAPDKEGTPWPPPALSRAMPKAKGASALMAVTLAGMIGLLFILAWNAYRGGYGWSLFLGLPFCLGLFSVLVYSF